MKWIVFFVVFLFLLAGCSEELPPSPPAPGAGLLAGRAMGGIPIAAGAIPANYSALKYTDVTPATAVFGDEIVVTVEKPSSITRTFYVYSEAWVLNKKFTSSFWEKAVAKTSQSGKITEKWAKDKATFIIPVSDERFVKGINYLLIYWCVDTGIRDTQGKKQWDCNGYKWGLGAFEVTAKKYSELIELDIASNKFISSVKITPPADAFTGTAKSSGTMGDAFTATYKNSESVTTEVTVIKLADVTKFKQNLAGELANLSSKWREKIGGATSGFLFKTTGKVSFSFMSGSYWITVKSYANALEEDKVGRYAEKYVPNNNLLAELELISKCGNSVINSPEECDPPNSTCSKGGVSGKCTSVCTCNVTVVSAVCGDGNCSGSETAQNCPADCTPIIGGGGATSNATASKCIDTDDENYFYKGTVTAGITSTNAGVATDDMCQDANTLLERTCSGTALFTKNINCPFGCDSGKCKPKTAPTECPDAVSVWSHEDKVNGRNIWFSEYYEPNVWAVSWTNAAVKTGEAASLAVLSNDDNDPDITSWQVSGTCGHAMAVWSNYLSSAASLSSSSVYYSIWTHNSGWTAPALVAQHGLDPAVAADWSGKAVAVFVRTDGLYASVYTGSWSSPARIVAANDVSLPDISWNPFTNKWYAVCYFAGNAVYLVFDGTSWVSANVGQSVGGSLVLPSNRMSVDSQWGGSEVTAVYESLSGSIGVAQLNPVFGVQVVSSLTAPDIVYDISGGVYHVLAKGNNKERYFDKGSSVADAADTSYIDGRPAHAYIVAGPDIAVWHSEDESTPFFSDIYWSRRDASGWSSAKRLVSLGLANYDKNADIAPLFKLMCGNSAYSEHCTNIFVVSPKDPLIKVPPGPWSWCGDGKINTPNSLNVNEQCEPPNTASCDGNCQRIGGAAGGCDYDGTTDSGEECDTGHSTASAPECAFDEVCSECVCSKVGTGLVWALLTPCSISGYANCPVIPACEGTPVPGQACSFVTNACLFNSKIYTCNTIAILMSQFSKTEAEIIGGVPLSPSTVPIVTNNMWLTTTSCQPPGCPPDACPVGIAQASPCPTLGSSCYSTAVISASNSYLVYTCMQGGASFGTGASDVAIGTGTAIYMDKPVSSGSGALLIFVAAFGILFVTLLNFIHRE